LLSQAQRINEVDARGRTALSVACSTQNVDLVRFLLSAPASLSTLGLEAIFGGDGKDHNKIDIILSMLVSYGFKCDELDLVTHMIRARVSLGVILKYVGAESAAWSSGSLAHKDVRDLFSYCDRRQFFPLIEPHKAAYESVLGHLLMDAAAFNDDFSIVKLSKMGVNSSEQIVAAIDKLLHNDPMVAVNTNLLFLLWIGNGKLNYTQVSKICRIIVAHRPELIYMALGMFLGT
jgi:ankyrin repeat protein